MLLNKQTIQILARLQLIVSIVLATAIVIGYVTYRASLGQVIGSLSASVIAISKTVEITADTIASREQLLESTKQTLMQTRSAIKSFSNLAQSQAKQSPQLAREIHAASAVASRLGETLNSIADGLMFSVPTDIQFEGVKPVLIMSRPLAPRAKKLKLDAHNIQTVSDGLLRTSNTIEKEGQGLGTEFGQLSEQTLKLLEETEKTLDGMQKRELPTAVREMRAAAEQLRIVSKEVDGAGKIGILLFAVGLLLASWIFLNSLGQLALANQISTKMGTGPDEKR